MVTFLQPAAPAPEVSIVVPVYFNAGSLLELQARLAAAMVKAGVESWDVTYVDDGSGDESAQVLEQLRAANPGVRVLRLSRNFGSQAAIQAGLQLARGRAVIALAADLQDPPELLPALLERWRAGVKVVLATRESRQDPLASRIFSAIFYRLFRLLVSKDMPRGGFDFFLLDQQVAQALVLGAEKNTNLPAAILWLGFRREFIPYHREERQHGASMWTFWKKVKYMYDSLLSFSYIPLRAMTALGAFGMIGSIGYAGFILFHTIFRAREAPGWASLMVVTLFFSGLTLAAVGIVGEYVWRTFDAARRRPGFIVDQTWEPAALARPAQGAGEGPRGAEKVE